MTPTIFPTTPDCEIVSSRIVNAPRQLVFQAWTDPAHLKEWWGPAGFTNTFHEFELRVGGKWRFIMHGPDKGNYPNEVEFVQIDEPTLIAWKRISKPLFNVVATFEAVGTDKTNLVFRMVFESANECDKIRRFAVEKNEENFDKLEVELINMAADEK
ncbi:MAG: SRPBCC family protein [Ferruginibacter sp.]|nr:SRPBCC family protein [Ferruginibacter sp.]